MNIERFNLILPYLCEVRNTGCSVTFIIYTKIEYNIFASQLKQFSKEQKIDIGICSIPEYLDYSEYFKNIKALRSTKDGRISNERPYTYVTIHFNILYVAIEVIKFLNAFFTKDDCLFRAMDDVGKLFKLKFYLTTGGIMTWSLVE